MPLVITSIFLAYFMEIQPTLRFDYYKVFSFRDSSSDQPNSKAEATTPEYCSNAIDSLFMPQII